MVNECRSATRPYKSHTIASKPPDKLASVPQEEEDSRSPQGLL